MHPTPRRAGSLLVVAVLLLGACTGGDDEPPGETPDEPAAADTELNVSVASFDVHVGDGQRLMAGITTAERGLVAFGEVDFELGPVDADAGGAAPSESATARFLPVPGDEPEGGGGQPTVLVGEPGAGVYEASVDLDEPGPWMLRVVAELADGTTREGTAAFQVGEEPQVPAEGDEAPRTDNLTVDDVDGEEVLPVMIDSRAQEADDEVPDPHIHDTTIAEAIDAGRPVVALFSTPVYCVSRFCGPITEVFGDLARDYGDRAEFVHVEVWRDFDEQQLNEAAAEWIQTETGGNEPWTFLVDEEGRVAARWDNVLDVEDLVAALEQLPAIVDNEGE